MKKKRKAPKKTSEVFAWDAPVWGETPWGGNDPVIYNVSWGPTYSTNRRVIWQDVKNSLWSLWTIMKDYLQTKSRSFYENSGSRSASANSTTGCTAKLAPSSKGVASMTYGSPSEGSTSTICFDGSKQKKRKSSRSGTKSHHHHSVGGYFLCFKNQACTGFGKKCYKRDL